jgi:hypothetical protein
MMPNGRREMMPNGREMITERPGNDHERPGMITVP